MDSRDFAHVGIHKYVTNVGEHYITVEIDDDCEPFKLPFKFEVCNTCRGRGSYVDPNIDRNGISMEEFNMDPSFHDDYMSGVYSVTCNACNGQRVYPEINTKAFNKEQKENYKKLMDEVEDDYEFEHISQWEQRCGY